MKGQRQNSGRGANTEEAGGTLWLGSEREQPPRGPEVLPGVPNASPRRVHLAEPSHMLKTTTHTGIHLPASLEVGMRPKFSDFGIRKVKEFLRLAESTHASVQKVPSIREQSLHASLHHDTQTRSRLHRRRQTEAPRAGERLTLTASSLFQLYTLGQQFNFLKLCSSVHGDDNTGKGAQGETLCTTPGTK